MSTYSTNGPSIFHTFGDLWNSGGSLKLDGDLEVKFPGCSYS
jgi:hypothetical protein